MTQHNTQRLSELLKLKERRLHELEKRKSVGGIDTPPHINMEIEDITHDIAVMRDALSTGIVSTKTATSEPTAKPQARNNFIPWAIISSILLLTNILLIYRTPIPILPPNDLSINSIPLKVWPGIGPNFDKDSYNKLVVIKNGDNPTDISYKYYFSIPGRSGYYNSLVFEFNNSEDLSLYNKVQLDITINRSNEFSFDLNFNSQRNDRDAYYTRKLSSIDGETINVAGDGIRKVFTFDMSEVKTKIDSKNIVWIWIVVGNDSENLLVSDFTVNQITFIRS